MTRTPEGLERRKIQARERKRKKYREDPEWRQRHLEKKKLEYAQNIEAERARCKDYYERNKQKRLADRKRWASENRERQREIARACYNRRPEVVVSRIATELGLNRLGVDEAHRRIGEELARANQRCEQRRSLPVRETDSGTSETET